jgi:hypothetical protein
MRLPPTHANTAAIATNDAMERVASTKVDLFLVDPSGLRLAVCAGGFA